MKTGLAVALTSRAVAPLDGFAAKVWERFIERVTDALLEAHMLIRSGQSPVAFTSKDGWWREGTYKIGATAIKVPAEDSITDLLVRTLEDIRNAATTDDLLHRQGITFSQQVPRRTQKRIGSKALTTDIRASSSVVPTLDLRIEAKVMFGGNDAGAYCGKAGLLRFGDVEEPYTDAPVGGMLGYLLRHDSSRWRKIIEAKAGAGKSLGVKGHEWHASDIVRGTACTTVLHFALPFDTEPEARALDAARKHVRRKL